MQKVKFSVLNVCSRAVPSQWPGALEKKPPFRYNKGNTKNHSMTNTQSTTVSDTENAELARDLYNTLMADIEPDLLLENLPLLDAKYDGETPEQKAVRLQGYEAAYAKFDAEFEKFMSGVNEEVRTSRRSALQEKEAAAKQSDQPLLASLEDAFR